MTFRLKPYKSVNLKHLNMQCNVLFTLKRLTVQYYAVSLQNVYSYASLSAFRRMPLKTSEIKQNQLREKHF